jgi:hypothetical protein
MRGLDIRASRLLLVSLPSNRAFSLGLLEHLGFEESPRSAMNGSKKLFDAAGK